MIETGAKVWRIIDILKVSEQALKDRDIESPRLNADILLADTLNTTRINLYLDFEKPLSDTELDIYRARIRRRLNREPLQYILGWTEFFGLRFNVNPSVLIPRQETEVVVEKTLETAQRLTAPKILEVGCGSGCIAVSIANSLECSIDAIDISDEALKTAKENAELNNAEGKINFIKKDFLNDTIDLDEYDMIVSNPPYIPAGDIEELQNEVKDFEPLNALTDNSDGLTFYRRFIEALTPCPSPEGRGEVSENTGMSETKKKTYFILELGDNCSERVQELFRQNNITDYFIFKDLNNIDRVITFEVN